MDFLEKAASWLTGGGWEAITTICMFLVSIVSTIATKMMTGPRAEKAATVADKMKAAIRFMGGGQFKDEPGGWSVPFVQPDSKLRVVDGKVESLVPPKTP